MATLANMIAFHSARLTALDNWAAVQSAMAEPNDRIGAVAQTLGVSDLGALSVIAMAHGRCPERSQIVADLEALDYLRNLIDSDR